MSSPTAQEFGYMAFKSTHSARTYFLVAADDITEFFGIQLLGEGCGALAVAEHDR